MVDRNEPIADWERDLLKIRLERPVRPNRPRRAPPLDGPARKQCSSWGTFEEQPYRCDYAPHGPEKKHRAFITFEYDRPPEAIKW